MEVSVRIKIKILKQLAPYSIGDKSPYFLLSYDNYFDSMPVYNKIFTYSPSINENSVCIHDSIISIKSTVKSGVYSQMAIDELKKEDIAGTIQKKYKSNDFYKKTIPVNSQLIFKLFTPQKNSMDQTCDVIKCAALIPLRELQLKKNMHIPMYMHDHNTEFGTIIVEVKQMKFNKNVSWSIIKTIGMGDPIGSSVGNYKDNLNKHLRIAYNFNSKISSFMTQFDFSTIYKSSRIRCEYNFSSFGNFIPMSFVIVSKYRSNSKYWIHMFAICLSDVLIRFGFATYTSIKNYNIYSLGKKYWKKLSLGYKCIVLTLMLRKLPNALPYISDFISYNNDNKKPSENFNPCSIFNGSSDCEDDAQVSMTLYNAFVQLEIDPNTSPVGLYELWVLAKCFIDSMTLYRVTTAEVRGIVDNLKNGITAHMNLILIPMGFFLENLSIDDMWNRNTTDGQMRKLKNNVLLMKKKFEKNVELLSTLNGISVTSIKNELPVLIVEGTGPLCPFKMKPPNFNSYRYVKFLFSKYPKVLTNIYHGPKSVNTFFTHAMLGFSDMNKFGIPCDGFVYSIDKRTSVKPTYGARFSDLRNKKNTKFILRPLMSQQELDSAYFTSRLQLTSPSFFAHYNINEKLNVLLTEKQSFNSFYMDDNKKDSSELRKSQIRICKNIKLKMMDNSKKIFSDQYKTVLISMRVQDLEYTRDTLIRKLTDSESIQDIDFYFEDMLEGISNVVFALKISSE